MIEKDDIKFGRICYAVDTYNYKVLKSIIVGTYPNDADDTDIILDIVPVVFEGDRHVTNPSRESLHYFKKDAFKDLLVHIDKKIDDLAQKRKEIIEYIDAPTATTIISLLQKKDENKERYR